MCFKICATDDRVPFQRYQNDRIRRWIPYYAIITCVHFYTVYILQKYVHALYVYLSNNLALAVNLKAIVVILEVHYIPKQHNFRESYAHIHTTFVPFFHYLFLQNSRTNFSSASNSAI